MTPARRLLLAGLAVNLLLLMLQGQANHYLSRWQIHLWLGALVITPVALHLAYRPGLLLVLLSGLLWDASTPVGFGLHAFLFALGHLIIYRIRSRLAREETPVIVLVTVLANLGLLVLLNLRYLGAEPDPGRVGARMFVDLLLAQVAIALIAPWFTALLLRGIAVAGGREPEETLLAT
jgi:cell shape-determining protein MreD